MTKSSKSTHCKILNLYVKAESQEGKVRDFIEMRLRRDQAGPDHQVNENSCTQTLGKSDCLESSFAEKNPRLLVDKLTVSQQCTLVAKKANNVARRLLVVILLLYTALVRTATWTAVCSSGLLNTRETWTC